jgi:sugar lactone lactonase YvrE
MRFFDASGRQVPYLFETNPDVTATGAWNLMQGDIIEIPVEFTFTAPVTLNSVKDTDGELSGNTNKSVIINTNDTFYVRLQVVAGAGSGYSLPTVSTLAGSGSVAGYADDVGSAARFDYPFGSAMDPSGNMYVSEIINHCIRKITPDGTVTTVAGTPAVGGYTDGAALSAEFSSPAGLALDTAGNLYICDIGNNALRMLSPAGIVSTICSGLNGPQFCTVNPSDSSQVYVSDSGNNRVVSVNIATGAVTSLVSGFLPTGIAYHAGHLYVAQHVANGVNPIGINKIPLPPAGVTSSTATAIPLTGTLGGPLGITVLSDGTIYIVDHVRSSIYKVMPDGTQTLFAGTGVAGYLDGSVVSAQFNLPANVVHDSAGNLYVTGYPSPTIRKITL